ncbi:MAG: zinc ribbon domain-containing protein [Verrucomicrobia bacterium]|nr:MAG: zinc ribbon domain-containing protein [Verrucomicrobiota bacterium]
MPLFEFTCRMCGKRFELLLRSRSEKARCPECGSTRVERQFSGFFSRVSGNQGGASSPCSGCTATSCSSCSVRR